MDTVTVIVNGGWKVEAVREEVLHEEQFIVVSGESDTQRGRVVNREAVVVVLERERCCCSSSCGVGEIYASDVVLKNGRF